MTKFLTALEDSWLAQLVGDYRWGFPALEIMHLCGLTLVFGGVVIIDFRLLGVRRDVSVLALERHVLPFVWSGFAIAALSGAWLFAYEARTLAADTPFLLKMILIPLAGLNALFMHKVAMREPGGWDTGARAPALVRLSAALSLLLWLVILACGRLIAYFYPVVF